MFKVWASKAMQIEKGNLNLLFYRGQYPTLLLKISFYLSFYNDTRLQLLSLYMPVCWVQLVSLIKNYNIIRTNY